MKRLLSLGLTVAALSLGLTSAALSQSDRAVERSGHTFHVKACAGAVGPEVAQCHAHIVSDSKGNLVENAKANALPAGYGPADLRAAYGITGNGLSTSTIAIVDAYGYNNAESDLATYRSTFGLPACTTANGCFKKVNQSGVAGNYPRQNTGWAQETALDLQMASAICPACKILLVEANTASFSDLATAVDRAALMGAIAISNSYGGGESGSATYEYHYNKPNIAVTVSSGDSGYGVQFPASSPNVIAVGGTSLTKSGGVFAETAWSGAGSGCSAVYNKPYFQFDADCARRTVADISAVADPNTGVAVYGPTFANRSGWLVFGGTSVAAPLIAGVYGVNGFANGTAASLYGGAGYRDVQSGSNGSCGGSYLCTAVPGYDGPTGLGTPNGSAPF